MQRKTQRERENNQGEGNNQGDDQQREKMQPSLKVKNTVKPVMFRIRMTARLV